MRKALLHPFPNVLLAASLALAGSAWSVLDRWSDQALWILVSGVAAYVVSILVVSRLPGDPDGAGEGDPEDGEEEPDFPRAVGDALRHLNNPAALSRSRLITLLVTTIAANGSAEPGNARPKEMADLDKAQALRGVLIEGIERFKPPGDAASSQSPQAIQYHILQEAYLQGRPVAYIVTRHNISETNYHRNRRAAITAVARHLESQERLNRGAS